MQFGKTLKLIRVLKVIKQKDLAEKLGISPNYLSLIENDRREPSLSFIRAISKELGVPVSFLFLDTTSEEHMTDEQKALFGKIKNLLREFQDLKIISPDEAAT